MYLVAYLASLHISKVAVGFFWGFAIGFILDLPEHHIHYVLRQTWILKPGPNDTDDKPQSTMYGFVLPQAYTYIYMLTSYTMLMLVFVAGIFWNEFLLEMTIQHSCNPFVVECFFIKNCWDSFKFVEPIDCNHVPSSVSTFNCFKYKLTSMVHLGLLDVCLEFVHSSLKCYQLAFSSWSDVMHTGIRHCGILSCCYVYYLLQ